MIRYRCDWCYAFGDLSDGPCPECGHNPHEQPPEGAGSPGKNGPGVHSTPEAAAPSALSLFETSR